MNKEFNENTKIESAESARAGFKEALLTASIFLYVFFLASILRDQADHLYIMGRSIPDQIIIENAVKIGFVLALMIYFVSFPVTYVLERALKLIVLLSNALDENFNGFLCKHDHSLACEKKEQNPFAVLLLTICGLVYLIIYVVSILIDVFKIFLMFL